MIDDQVTVVIPTSPIRKHPSTSMIRQTIKLVRMQLPEAQILILADGVREEQRYLKADYAIYLTRLGRWLKSHDEHATIIAFSEFQHQSGMIREAFNHIQTPLLLFIEHDFPVIGEIDWIGIADILLSGRADLVRFYLEPRLIPEHWYLFMDKNPVNIGQVPVVRTGQWSQRPHIARVDFYKRIMDLRFTDESRTYIEDGVHGYTGEAFSINKAKAWNENKMCIYYPEGSISRCLHLDGRGDEDKYEMIQ